MEPSEGRLDYVVVIQEKIAYLVPYFCVIGSTGFYPEKDAMGRLVLHGKKR